MLSNNQQLEQHPDYWPGQEHSMFFRSLNQAARRSVYCVNYPVLCSSACLNDLAQ